MTKSHFKSTVLFGGGGFIGTHLAAHLLSIGTTDRVFLADLQPARIKGWPTALQEFNKQGKVAYIQLDVRQPITHPELPIETDLIINLAAVHKEPGGHVPHDYFATNLPGAENVCAWAEQVHCNRIVFTSSIATYGAEDKSGDEIKNEQSLPTPLTPYGISKLVAEKIHIGWQKANANRKLLIVRPGVIFGPGENGNVTQMIRAVLGHYFFYIGNRHTRKAGGYVKELYRSITWMIDQQDTTEQGIMLYNFAMNPSPTVEEYAIATNKVTGAKRWIPSVPYSLLLLGSYIIDGLGRAIGMRQPINPIRVRKLLKSNYIEPRVLNNSGYTYHYSLESAMADWYKERPSDWRK